MYPNPGGGGGHRAAGSFSLEETRGGGSRTGRRTQTERKTDRYIQSPFTAPQERRLFLFCPITFRVADPGARRVGHRSADSFSMEDTQDWRWSDRKVSNSTAISPSFFYKVTNSGLPDPAQEKQGNHKLIHTYITL